MKPEIKKLLILNRKGGGKPPQGGQDPFVVLPPVRDALL